MEDRITGLEIRFMDQQNTIEELNSIVTRQELVIERLERDVALLAELCRTLSPSINRTADEEEPPPHY